MTRASAPAAAMFTGASGNTLAGDVYGEEGAPVLLLHGGGQTRHAWKKTGELIARMGRVAYAVDQRGHGDSEWVKDGAYQYEDFAADARVLADTLAQTERRAPGGGRRLARRDGGAAWRTAAGKRRGIFGARAGRHHPAHRQRRRRQDPGLHAGAAPRGFRLDR